MSNANFKENYARLLKKAGDKAELVVRKTAIELQSFAQVGRQALVQSTQP
jgi:hypothetical protein